MHPVSTSFSKVLDGRSYFAPCWLVFSASLSAPCRCLGRLHQYPTVLFGSFFQVLFHQSNELVDIITGTPPLSCYFWFLFTQIPLRCQSYYGKHLVHVSATIQLIKYSEDPLKNVIHPLEAEDTASTEFSKDRLGIRWTRLWNCLGCFLSARIRESGHL